MTGNSIYARNQESERSTAANAPSERFESQVPLSGGRVGRGVRSAFAFFFPHYRTEDDLFFQCIDPYVNSGAVLLDAGCGSGKFFSYPWKNEAGLVVGCDLGEDVGCNPNLSAAANANLEELPFRSESFDLIFSHYVWEHLHHPGKVFAEMGRVLKPGGRLFILTPNKNHYVPLVSRLTPHWIHERVALLRGNKQQDTFPTKYLVNTRRDMIRWVRGTPLTLKRFVAKEFCPNYLVWSLPSFLLGVAYERLVNGFEALSHFRVILVAEFQKAPADAAGTLDAGSAPRRN